MFILESEISLLNKPLEHDSLFWYLLKRLLFDCFNKILGYRDLKLLEIFGLALLILLKFLLREYDWVIDLIIPKEEFFFFCIELFKIIFEDNLLLKKRTKSLSEYSITKQKPDISNTAKYNIGEANEGNIEALELNSKTKP